MKRCMGLIKKKGLGKKYVKTADIFLKDICCREPVQVHTISMIRNSFREKGR
jgi:hypothetical protein